MDRIQLGNEEFEGRNNAYLLRSRDAVALVDTGIATPRTRQQLVDGLAAHDLAFADIDDVVLTHWHMDHAGLAGEIQAAGGATVYAHEADAALVAGDDRAHEALRERQVELFTEWGMPQEAREELFAFFEAGAGIEGEDVAVTPVEDGDRLPVGGATLEVVHAPGHTAGLCCFERDGGRGAFSGDAVLPVYTPNVGGADVRVERPLASYIDTLQRIAARDYATLWPGHRDPIESPTERVEEIVAHHRQRTERVIAVLDEHGPATAWAVSDRLFGDLSGVHIMHGPGEAYAHLDHLCRAGHASEDDGRYRLVGGQPNATSLFSNP